MKTLALIEPGMILGGSAMQAIINMKLQFQPEKLRWPVEIVFPEPDKPLIKAIRGEI